MLSVQYVMKIHPLKIHLYCFKIYIKLSVWRGYPFYLGRTISSHPGHFVLDSISSSSCEKDFWVTNQSRLRVRLLKCNNCGQDVIVQNHDLVT